MKKLITTITLLFLSPLIFSQQQESTPDSESTTEPQTARSTIEEISVTGERTTYSLRLEIESAETEVYSLFNDLNSNDEFDVTCEEVVYTGSHLPVRTCMAAYLRREEARQTQNYIQSLSGGSLGAPGSGALLDRASIRGEALEKTKAMEQEMIRLAIEVPEFTAALKKLSELVGALEARTKN
jgi:hypothetical protein